MMKKLILTSALLVSLNLSSARADTIFGEFKRLPETIERGFSVGFDFGLLFLVDPPPNAIKNPGFNLTFTTGYDLSDYLSIDGIYQLGINEADPIVLGGSVQTYLFGLAAKGQFPLGRLYPFAEIGGAIHYGRPSWNAGENYKPAILIAGGFEYYTYLRHYSLYLKGTYNYITADNPDTLTISAGLKYTF